MQRAPARANVPRRFGGMLIESAATPQGQLATAFADGATPQGLLQREYFAQRQDAVSATVNGTRSPTPSADWGGLLAPEKPND
jgi:hypothetical protein